MQLAGERSEKSSGPSFPGILRVKTTVPSRQRRAAAGSLNLLSFSAKQRFSFTTGEIMNTTAPTRAEDYGQGTSGHGLEDSNLPPQTEHLPGEVRISFTADPVKLGLGNKRQRSLPIYNRRSRGLCRPRALPCWFCVEERRRLVGEIGRRPKATPAD